MCVKTPKAPPKTAEELALEEEARAAREQRKRELAVATTREKNKRYEETAARARGLFGMRSLISGPKGGAGFSGSGGRSGLPLIPTSGASSGGSPAPGGGSGFMGGGFGGDFASLISGRSDYGAGGFRA